MSAEASDISVPKTDDNAVGHKARVLSSEEIEKLEKDKKLVSEFKQCKLEKEAQKNWDLFYKRNTTKFFKDRHWTKREFSDLVCNGQTVSRKTVLEVGCGVGNFLFPLLEEDKSLYFYACDFSQRAVDFLKSRSQFDASRCTVFQCDITCMDLTDTVPADSVDAVTMIFVLSAIHPDKMQQALCNVYKVLRPGGCLLLRDYGLYDYAMLRFAPGHKLSDNFYVRQDGTRAYYFSLEILGELLKSAGFVESSHEYVQRETVNKKEGICVPRIFVQSKFLKPSTPHTSSHTTDCETEKYETGKCEAGKYETDVFSDDTVETENCESELHGGEKCDNKKCEPGNPETKIYATGQIENKQCVTNSYENGKCATSEPVQLAS